MPCRCKEKKRHCKKGCDSSKHLKYIPRRPVQVTGQSRLPPTLDNLRLPSDPYTQRGLWTRNVADECWIAVNPCNPKNLIICTHQDVYSNSDVGVGFLSDVYLYSLDGGETWNYSDLVLSRSQGPTLKQSDQDFESASDPNVVFDYHGNAFAYAVSFNSNENFEEANVYAKSTDGGRSWTTVFHTTRDNGDFHFLDRPLMTADPYRKNNIYALTSDRQALVGLDDNLSIFQKSIDGGNIFGPKIVAQTWDVTRRSWGERLHVLPSDDHPLVIITSVQYDEDVGLGKLDAVCYRSFDIGDTWGPVINIYTGGVQVEATDPEDTTQTWVSFAGGVTSAINQCNGYLYASWMDQLANPNSLGPRIFISMSKDGGATWLPQPLPLPGAPAPVQQFCNALAVNENGTVGMLYYDFRNYTGPGDPNGLSTDAWLALFDKNLNFLGEVRLTPQSFDIRQVFWVRPTARFLADYVCLTSSGNDFHASFPTTNLSLNGTQNTNPFPLSESEITIVPPISESEETGQPQLVRQFNTYVKVTGSVKC